jgi:hypothetical protein
METAMESTRTHTSSTLEVEIAEVQKCLDDATRRKAYDECAQHQQKLESLITERAVFPTIDELSEKLQEVEAEAAAAGDRRDFSAAAAGQACMNEARRRLEEAVAAETIGDDDSLNEGADDVSTQGTRLTRRADLEDAISSLNKKMK